MGSVYTVLLVVHTIIVLFLIFFVLLQRTGDDGLSGLGGGGGNQFLTGRGSANLLTRTTAVLAGVFMLTSMTLAVMGSRMTTQSVLDAAPVEDAAAPGQPGETQDTPAQKAGPSVPKPE